MPGTPFASYVMSSRHVFTTRSAGKSVAGALAYAKAEVVVDQRTGYVGGRRQEDDVLKTGVVVPERSRHVNWVYDTQQFANRLEQAEDDFAGKKYALGQRKADKFREENPEAALSGVLSMLPDDWHEADDQGRPCWSSTKKKSWKAEQLRRFKESDHARTLKKAGFVIQQDEVDGVLIWGALSAAEKHRATAQTAMTVHYSLWHGFSHDQADEVIRRFLKERYGANGLAAHYALHTSSKNAENLHFHVVSATREMDELGALGKKPRFYQRTPLLSEWEKGNRVALARVQTEMAAELGMTLHVSQAKYADQGTALEPTIHEGWYPQDLAMKNAWSAKRALNQAIKADNAETVFSDPWQVIGDVQESHAVFSEDHIRRAMAKGLNHDEQLLEAAWPVMKQHIQKNLVELGEDVDGVMYYTTQQYALTEERAIERLHALEARRSHSISARRLEERLQKLEANHAAFVQGIELPYSGVSGKVEFLSKEQADAVRLIAEPAAFAAVKGSAGVGKTTLLQYAVEEWKASGYRVKGMAIASIAAETLGVEAGIADTSSVDLFLTRMDALEKHMQDPREGDPRWEKTKAILEENKLRKRDVVIVDEASMLDTLKVEKLARYVEEAGAKLVLVGDDMQYGSIAAGRMFEYVVSNLRTARVSTIFRQKAIEDVLALEADGRPKVTDWMSKAAMAFERRDARAGVGAYYDRGQVHIVDDDKLHSDVVKRYFELYDRSTEAENRDSKTRMIVASENRTVDALNDRIHAELVRRGVVTQPVRLVNERFPSGRSFGVGDQILFLENDRRAKKVVDVTPAEGDKLDKPGEFPTSYTPLYRKSADASLPFPSKGVKNGQRAVVKRLEPIEGNEGGYTVYAEVTDTDVKTGKESQRLVKFNSQEYTAFGHSMAVTGYKSQGQTVKQVLAVVDKRLKLSGAYVFFSRHKEHFEAFASKNDFNDFDDMAYKLGRMDHKTMVRDFTFKSEEEKSARELMERFYDIRTHKALLGATVYERQRRAVKAGAVDRQVTEDWQYDLLLSRTSDEREVAAEVLDAYRDYQKLRRIPATQQDSEQKARMRFVQSVVTTGDRQGLTREQLEWLVDPAKKPKSPAQKAAGARLHGLAYLRDKARDLWNEIKLTHPGRAAKTHDKYGEFDHLRGKRDAMAADLTNPANPETSLNMRAAGAAKISWREVERMARDHHVRNPPTNLEELARIEAVAAYKESRLEVDRLWAEISAKGADSGPEPLKHPKYQEYAAFRSVRDEQAIRIFSSADSFTKELDVAKLPISTIEADFRLAISQKSRRREIADLALQTSEGRDQLETVRLYKEAIERGDFQTRLVLAKDLDAGDAAKRRETKDLLGSEGIDIRRFLLDAHVANNPKIDHVKAEQVFFSLKFSQNPDLIEFSKPDYQPIEQAPLTAKEEQESRRAWDLYAAAAKAYEAAEKQPGIDARQLGALRDKRGAAAVDVVDLGGLRFATGEAQRKEVAGLAAEYNDSIGRTTIVVRPAEPKPGISEGARLILKRNQDKQKKPIGGES